MISKIYKYAAKYKLTEMGKRKGTKRPNRSQAYKEAVAMSSLGPRVKRIVKYKKTESNEQ